MVIKNATLNNARSNKHDEFYTQLIDVENELIHYKKHFENKTVLCNCDDPRTSNFFNYFLNNFENLGIKKLITTCYKNQQMNLFSTNKPERAVWLEYNGKKNDNKIPTVEEIGINYLQGEGDFRSQECINLLKESDIIVTNPPFSLFREYVAQLVKYNKKFLILGNLNAITYKEIFKLLKENKMWLGASIHNGGREFGIPNNYVANTSNLRVDKDGRKFVIMPGIRWFTNLDYETGYKDIILYKKYTPEEYPKYDDYNAINVNKTKEIPIDYDGIMGVPISFLDKYNPNQFEIIGIDRYVKDNPNYGYRFKINKKETYARILIKHRYIKNLYVSN